MCREQSKNEGEGVLLCSQPPIFFSVLVNPRKCLHTCGCFIFHIGKLHKKTDRHRNQSIKLSRRSELLTLHSSLF